LGNFGKSKIWTVASKEELECEDHSIKSFYRLPSGAYSVRSSLKPHAKALGDSYTQAHRRSLNLERKLQRNPHLKHKYDAFIKKYLELNHSGQSARGCGPLPEFRVAPLCSKGG